MQRIPLYISILALAIAGTCLYLSLGKKQKLAYAQLATIYNEFQLKKELESKFQNVSQLRQHILDSLKLELQILSSKVKSETDRENIQAFQVKRQEYMMKEQNFSQSNEETTVQYKSQIWKQLSQYIKQYGKEHGYTYIFGFDADNGSLLYGDEPDNITESLKNYVNEAYKGGAGK